MKISLSILFLTFSIIAYSQPYSKGELPKIDSIGIVTDLGKVDLDSTIWKSMGLDAIELYQPYTEYSIIYDSRRGCKRIVIIEKATDEEFFHWTCILKRNGKLLDWIRTAYDNSEGFLNIKTEINDNKFSIREWNLYSDPKETVQSYYLIKKSFVKKLIALK